MATAQRPDGGGPSPANPPLKTPEAYTIPISSRAPQSTLVQTILFAVVFNFCILSANLVQILAFPLSLHPNTQPYFVAIIRYTKLAFGRALLVISQFFGPTRLVLSFGDGKGGYLDPEQFVQRDKQSGKVQHVDLPRKSVWMSNHQVYTDWLYLWCLAYYSDLADSILIILKKSLKWVPFVGWGMQFFRFIFLARNWAADQGPLAQQLEEVAAHRIDETEATKKLLLLIFPEGTLVSPNTRPLSKKYADKMGYEDLENLLLPRSTGLFFCLRTLGREVDDLWLVDFTTGYPGIPPAGYGQSYYTLRSVFMQGVPPPAVHLHFTMTRLTAPKGTTSFNPASVSSISTSDLDVPALGDLSSKDSSEAEKKAFDEWLRNRWMQKDELMRSFYRHGDFVQGAFDKVAKERGLETKRDDSGRFVVVPAELRSLSEVGDACCWGLGIVGAWYAAKTLAWAWSFFKQ
ncbi:uncharacterized protein PFL1_01916 [Pseudozyma flocculosa PF-1]|uniref:Related to CST26 - protein required for incorporation of stearic acid into phosphatidylinositol n=1 Tax=Pseudozyma flocculosa TaxID=84751 RepID=A0A5C3EYV6_9BASI|nr:uncharacterized protein PFL1_01916 [Pseudozyma flocculosa PF-1]EPQ30390.1 hypothetical protein PFL1_01916 [Pseudozyma flocculosa PF-1]SPO37464.1 related to CST26 - protein required for incorporation of stearic acid into phosphatidylinositol [Pseudozyma flocculosa]